MIFPALLTADWHMTSNPRDEYRWGLFQWLRTTIKEKGVKSLLILGDLSDAKDFHPSSLVNRLAREFALLMEFPWLRCYMIPGNHEWLKQGEEFWRFLNYVSDRIHYMTSPSDDPHPAPGSPCVHFLPFTRNPAKDWKGLDFSHYDYLFMHQTVKGSLSSNGQEMDGEALPDLSAAGKVYSGDIHVPQRVGPVEYVGSPYHVHFGDSFTPRCVLLTKDGAEDLHFPTISRVTLDVTGLHDLLFQAESNLRPGDQVKLRIALPEAEKHAWKAIRRDALTLMSDARVEVHGIELAVQKSSRRRLVADAPSLVQRRRLPGDDVMRFVMAEDLGPSALDVALEVIEQ